MFEGGIVKIVEIIQRAHRVPRVEQPLAHVRTDEPHTSCDQNIHAPKITANRCSVEVVDGS